MEVKGDLVDRLPPLRHVSSACPRMGCPVSLIFYTTSLAASEVGPVVLRGPDSLEQSPGGVQAEPAVSLPLTETCSCAQLKALLGAALCSLKHVFGNIPYVCICHLSSGSHWVSASIAVMAGVGSVALAVPRPPPQGAEC